MKKAHIILVFISAILLCSCSIQKRKHLSGFHIQLIEKPSKVKRVDKKNSSYSAQIKSFQEKIDLSATIEKSSNSSAGMSFKSSSLIPEDVGVNDYVNNKEVEEIQHQDSAFRPKSKSSIKRIASKGNGKKFLFVLLVLALAVLIFFGYSSILASIVLFSTDTPGIYYALWILLTVALLIGLGFIIRSIVSDGKRKRRVRKHGQKR